MFPHFKVASTDLFGGDGSEFTDMHFMALFSTNPLATPVLLLHGWPGSFLEFIPLLTLLR